MESMSQRLEGVEERTDRIGRLFTELHIKMTELSETNARLQEALRWADYYVENAVPVMGKSPIQYWIPGNEPRMSLGSFDHDTFLEHYRDLRNGLVSKDDWPCSTCLDEPAVRSNTTRQRQSDQDIEPGVEVPCPECGGK